MIAIRPDQMDAFAEAALKNFENSMVDHVRQFLPRHLEILGEPTVRQVIRLGIDRGSVYGLISQHDLCLYITLMFLLGSSFDEDPQLPWADTILSDESILDNAQRTEQLYDEAVDFLDKAAGNENEYQMRALVTLRKHPIQETWKPGPGSLEDRILAQLRDVWPQKCERVGDGPLRLLIHRGIEAARSHQLAGELGALIYVGLMFLLGSGFDADPQYPWAAAVLNDTSAAGQATKAGRLYEAAMAYLDQWLART